MRVKVRVKARVKVRVLHRVRAHCSSAWRSGEERLGLGSRVRVKG